MHFSQQFSHSSISTYEYLDGYLNLSVAIDGPPPVCPPQVAIGSGRTVEQVAAQEDARQFLRNVLSWLVINSMRVDGIQFNLLCEQSVANVWRKRAFYRLRTEFRG